MGSGKTSSYNEQVLNCLALALSYQVLMADVQLVEFCFLLHAIVLSLFDASSQLV